MTDTDPFEMFVRRYQDMVYATAVRLLRTPVEAEDVAQIVFLRAFQRFDQIGASPAAAGWLKTVTRNTCLNHLSRYRSRWRFFSELGRSDSRDSRATDELALVATHSPAVDVELEDRRDDVTRALHRLPDHQRVPLALFHFEEMSYQEIAAALGVSVGRVKTDIHRGRETLRGLLSDHAPR